MNRTDIIKTVKKLSETMTRKRNTRSGMRRVIGIILLISLLAATLGACGVAEKELKWAEKEARVVNQARLDSDPLTILKDDIRKKERNPIPEEDPEEDKEADAEKDQDENQEQGSWSGSVRTGGSFIFYFSGVDTRNDYLVDSNSDVNIVAAINPTTRQILFVNTPRDYYVQISIGGGSYDKLSHCGNYGLQCSRDTIGILYGISIDYAAQINFVGLKTLVDQIGGVDVYSELAFTAYNGMTFDYGYNHLNGARALAYCRERKSLPGGDNDRGRHQIQVLTSIVQTITSSPSLLLNYQGIIDSLNGLFKTDMSMDKVAELVNMQIADSRAWDIKYYAVTGYNSYSSYTYSMPGTNLFVMEQNPNSVWEARALIDKVLAGESI